MDQDTRAKAIQAAYRTIAAGGGYVSTLQAEDGEHGALVDTWVNLGDVVDVVADVLGGGSGAPASHDGEPMRSDADIWDDAVQRVFARREAMAQHPSNGVV